MPSRIRRLRRWQTVPPALFIIGSIVGFVVVGIPYSTDVLFIWLLIGLGCFSVSDLRGFGRGLIRDWLPFVAILVAYDSLRGTAGRLFPVHFLPQIQIDRFFFGGQIPTVTLQRWLWHGHVVWYDIIPWATYLSHFFFTPILAAVLWKVNHERFRWFIRRVIALSFAGLLTYALYPAAPPWMAEKDHLIAPITRILPLVWNWVPIHGAGAIFEKGEAYANNVAAMPSLHAAFSLLIACTLWPMANRFWRPFVALYPLLMTVSVIYLGEHYFSDVLFGWIYTGGVLLGFRYVPVWWKSRRAEARTVAHSTAG